MPETTFAPALRQMQSAPEAGRLDAAQALLGRGRVSSAQVKAVAALLPDDEARFHFCVAAHPVTVDPENFYDVYDAFRSFSRVFRLHDAVRGGAVPPAPMPVPPPAPAAITDAEARGMVRALENESFDDRRLAVARPMVTGARGRLLSRHVRDLLATFSFDDRRLELAKLAFDSVVDPWNYHVVNETFTFASNREALARHLQQRSPPPR